MRFSCTVMCLGLSLYCVGVKAQSTTPTNILLDATVLDREGHPVVKGLTKDDFAITEDDQPEPIVSFEQPISERDNTVGLADDASEGGGRVILVLDFLNSSFQDIAFIRTSVKNYLMTQPPNLTLPTEMLVLGERTLDLMHRYTRSRLELIDALDRQPPVNDDQERRNALFEGRYRYSVEALRQIALQNRGVPGPKSIVWVGLGGPNFVVSRGIGSSSAVAAYAHETSDLLLGARMRLFVVYPGLEAQNLPHGDEEMTDASNARAGITSAHAALKAEDPFADNMNFGVFVKLTGGDISFGQNDVATEIKNAVKTSRESYMLSYLPSKRSEDGQLRRIHVTVRNPALQLSTEAGYFAADTPTVKRVREQMVADLTEVARSNLPFDALGMKVQRLVRHPDTGTLDVTAMVELAKAVWKPSEHGKSATELVVAVAALGAHRDVLASRVETQNPTAATRDGSRLVREVASIPETIHYSQKTRSVRVVIEDIESGRTGAIEFDRKVIDAAPATATPMPQLVPRFHGDIRESLPEK